MNEELLRELFRNNSDCYTDTNLVKDDMIIEEGSIIKVMTEDKFIETLKEANLLSSSTK